MKVTPWLTTDCVGDWAGPDPSGYTDTVVCSRMLEAMFPGIVPYSGSEHMIRLCFSKRRFMKPIRGCVYATAPKLVYLTLMCETRDAARVEWSTSVLAAREEMYDNLSQWLLHYDVFGDPDKWEHGMSITGYFAVQVREKE